MSSASAVRISAAARTARSASSSRTVGMPKTAITASPMNFSIGPAVAHQRVAHRLEVAGEHLPQGLRVERLAQARRAGEVAEHDRHDLPESLGRRRLGASAIPHAGQKRARSDASSPQLGHVRTRGSLGVAFADDRGGLA